jgi:hypothetical protein
MGELEKLSSKHKKLQDSLKPDSLLIMLQERQIVYEGYLKVSAQLSGLSYPHKQFDAVNKYNLIKHGFWDRRKSKEIPNTEKLQLVVHNIPNGTKIKISEKTLAFSDDEQFTTLVNEQLSKIDFSSLSSDLLNNIQDYFSSFSKIAAPGNKGVSTTGDNCAEAHSLIKKLYERYHNGEADFMPAPKLFLQSQDSPPKYTTLLEPSTIDAEESYKDSITLVRSFAKDSNKMENVKKTYVKVGKLRYFILSTGIAFNKSPVSTSQIDTSKNGFRISTADSRARTMFGFKFYPLKNYNRDHSIIPRYFLKRLSVFGGAEILKPLNNFYVGGAYDIVPGLAFSTGKNYTLQTHYSIQNDAVTKTSRSYVDAGTYYSVMVNPVLLIQFVKLLFK